MEPLQKVDVVGGMEGNHVGGSSAIRTVHLHGGKNKEMEVSYGEPTRRCTV